MSQNNIFFFINSIISLRAKYEMIEYKKGMEGGSHLQWSLLGPGPGPGPGRGREEKRQQGSGRGGLRAGTRARGSPAAGTGRGRA
ncbi:hypothetical protein ACJIZ3_019875 [Penstemon smallii]|uniref:Uncharacterized protein n=1 Tax=Penstemon smallii TaxID=265156 RepID=A0ABD3T3P7_9LAMI